MKEKILIVEDHFIEADYLRMMLSKEGYQICDIARSVDRAQEIIVDEKPDMVLLDIFLKGTKTGIDLAKELQKKHTPFIFLSANSNHDVLTAAKATQPYGFLVKPFRERDLLVALEIAKYRHEHSIETQLEKESALKQQLETLLTSSEPWELKLFNIAKIIQLYIPFDFLGAGLNRIGEVSCNGISFLRTAYDEYQTIGINELLLITGLTMEKLTELRALSQPEARPTIYNDQEFVDAINKPSLKKTFARTFNMQSHLSLPLRLSTGDIFNFCFYSRRPDAYNPEHLSLIERLEDAWASSIESMLLNGRGGKMQTTTSLQDDSKDMSATQGFKGIVGKSHLMLNVFDQLTLVAPSETSVLILGESGTGKELIADSIHALSPRKNMPFVKVNCAALPPTLIESELFGHEKGAFTGAHEKRIGRFEQAHKGTIFLDEIGELPLEFQIKFLRVLQEKEVERIGSKATTKVDVRIIAATNRNLEKEVAEGRFRLDLYYRLNVFPVELPALRDRKEDIPDLANHFLNYYNRKVGRKVTSFSPKALQRMISYNWPGNIRELEHLIERSVLLARGAMIEDIPLPSNANKESVSDTAAQVKSIQENERDHILSVLKKCNGKIWGPGAAAEILKIPPSTLKSRMRKLGIKKQYNDTPSGSTT